MMADNKPVVKCKACGHRRHKGRCTALMTPPNGGFKECGCTWVQKSTPKTRTVVHKKRPRVGTEIRLRIALAAAVAEREVLRERVAVLEAENASLSNMLSGLVVR